MNPRHLFWPKHSRLELGGGGGGGASAIQAAPVPLPAPPVTSSNREVIQAEQDNAMQNLMKKSVKKTIFAGDTGGYAPGGVNPAMGTPTPASYKKLG